MPSYPCGWSGHDAQRFWPLTCPGLMTSNSKQTPGRAPQCLGGRHGPPSWSLGLRSPVTTSACPSSSGGSGDFGFLARDCFQLSSPKSTTRLASTRKWPPAPQAPWVVSEMVGESQAGVLRPHQAPEAGPKGARAEGQGWAEGTRRR